jgi:hypothetical protein
MQLDIAITIMFTHVFPGTRYLPRAAARGAGLSRAHVRRASASGGLLVVAATTAPL